MKLPGPGHPIAIARNANRVRVIFDGKVVADTVRALTLRETHYPPVQYIPRADADMSLLRPSRHSTHCPYKGNASYFTIETGVRASDNAAWSYERPYAAMAEIEGHLAFYPNRVDRIKETPE
jgi:uncharacterized protein (DUF427 family)